MDRRTLLALLLPAIVIVVTPMLFPSPRQQRRPADSLRTKPDTGADTAVTKQPIAAPAPQPVGLAQRKPAQVAVRAETTIVRTELAVYRIVSPGATPANVTLPEYHSRRPDAPRNTPVDLLDANDRLLHLRLASDRDTI